MKNLTLKALFISAVAAFSLNVQAAGTYDMCISDAETLISIAKKSGIEESDKYENKTTVSACQDELIKIEAPYLEKAKGLNPSYVMTPADRAKWSKLFDAIDTKQSKGVAFLQAVYYR